MVCIDHQIMGAPQPLTTVIEEKEEKYNFISMIYDDILKSFMHLKVNIGLERSK